MDELFTRHKRKTKPTLKIKLVELRDSAEIPPKGQPPKSTKPQAKKQTKKPTKEKRSVTSPPPPYKPAALALPAVLPTPASLNEEPATRPISKPRKRRSPIWNEWYHIFPEGGGHLLSVEGYKLFRCRLCHERAPKKDGSFNDFRADFGTDTIINHLEKRHSIMGLRAEKKSLKHAREVEQLGQWLETAEGEGPQVKKRKTTEHEHSLDEATLIELFGEYVVDEDLSVSHSESRTLRNLLYYVNPAVCDLLPYSGGQTKRNLHRSLKLRKTGIIDVLKSAISLVHLTPDGWTSPNGLGILGIVAHFVSKDHGPQHLVIAMKELIGAHSGQNMAEVTADVLEDYGITSRVGYIMSDNVYANDTYVRHLSTLLEARGLCFDPSQRRLRCQGHIINLVVMSFFFDPHPNEDFDSYLGPTTAEADKWRRIGPLGKLHNIVVWVQSSTERRQEFRNLSFGLNLRRDQKTRWNSYYEMIQWALRKHIKEAIKQTVFDNLAALASDALTTEDWAKLAHFETFLQPFKLLTKLTEGQSSSIELVLPTMDFAMNHLEACKLIYAADDFMMRGIDTAWAKLEKYYKLADETPVYALATCLNPIQKWQYFDTNWAGHPDWLNKAKKAAKDFWEAKYRPDSVTTVPPVTTLSSNSFYAFYNRQIVGAAVKDEWQQYITSDPLPAPKDGKPFNALAWWTEETQRRQYPNLSKMALDLLSIPAMASDVERLFSAAKLTLTDQRGAMYAETLELLQLLKSWNRSSIFSRVQTRGAPF